MRKPSGAFICVTLQRLGVQATYPSVESGFVIQTTYRVHDATVCTIVFDRLDDRLQITTGLHFYENFGTYFQLITFLTVSMNHLLWYVWWTPLSVFETVESSADTRSSVNELGQPFHTIMFFSQAYLQDVVNMQKTGLTFWETNGKSFLISMTLLLRTCNPSRTHDLQLSQLKFYFLHHCPVQI